MAIEDKNQNTGQEDINKEGCPKNINNETTSEIGEPTEKSTELLQCEEKLAEMQDKYLRLSAEFDNYRKRTLKERYDLIKTAGEDVIQGFLSVVDDFDRAIAVMQQSNDVPAVKEGVILIYDKLMAYLKQKGLVEIIAQGVDFDTDYHEAISKMPVTDGDKKGKVVDVIQKGYMLHDKVIRYAKVIVGE